MRDVKVEVNVSWHLASTNHLEIYSIACALRLQFLLALGIP